MHQSQENLQNILQLPRSTFITLRETSKQPWLNFNQFTAVTKKRGWILQGKGKLNSLPKERNNAHALKTINETGKKKKKKRKVKQTKVFR